MEEIKEIKTLNTVWDPRWMLVWIKQLWEIYTIEYYSAVKKEENFILCNSMAEPGEHHAKRNKPSEKDKYRTIWFHSYVESDEQTALTSKIETD